MGRQIRSSSESAVRSTTDDERLRVGAGAAVVVSAIEYLCQGWEEEEERLLSHGVHFGHVRLVVTVVPLRTKRD